MLYPFMTLNDNTEITHSNMLPNGSVKVYVESPAGREFHSAVCWVPGYRWEEVKGYTLAEMEYYDELIRSVGHLILEFSQTGGILGAADI